MYRKSFPKCEIEGDMTPSPFGHGFMKGCVPKKCTSCKHLFEGECLRDLELTDGYLRLDYSDCPVKGETNPVAFKADGEVKTFIPSKCNGCSNLNTKRLTCKFEKELWGDFERDLDWGTWQPDYPLVGLRRVEMEGKTRLDEGPAVINKLLIQLIQNGNTVKAIKLYRELNKIALIKDAKDEVEQISERLQKRGNAYNST